MGRLEKIVVLTVVFLIAVILGISLNEKDEVADPLGGEEVAALSPAAAETERASPPWIAEPVEKAAAGGVAAAERGLLGGSRRDAAQEPPAETAAAAPRKQPVIEEPAGDPVPKIDVASRRDRSRDNRGLLNSSVRPEQPAGRVEPESDSLIVTTAGLTDTPYDDLKLYTWRTGDTFTSVAREYYGDLGKVELLRKANEGLTERQLRAGDTIFVPVHDSTAAARTNTYIVAEGDTLSGISLKVYGDSTRYMEIYEANTDILSTPDELALGQVLRIPR